MKFPRSCQCFHVNIDVSKLACVSNLITLFLSYVSKLIIIESKSYVHLYGATVKFGINSMNLTAWIAVCFQVDLSFRIYNRASKSCFQVYFYSIKNFVHSYDKWEKYGATVKFGMNSMKSTAWTAVCFQVNNDVSKLTCVFDFIIVFLSCVSKFIMPFPNWLVFSSETFRLVAKWLLRTLNEKKYGATVKCGIYG